MPLVSVPVDFDDDAHARLDALVFNQSPGGPDSPMMVLMKVVQHSDGKLDQQYRDIVEAERLLEIYPELRDKIKEAYDMRSFKDIRNLKILQTVTSKPTKTIIYHRTLPHRTHNEAIASAWDQPYSGDCAKTLYTSLTKMKHGGPYSNAVSILQSSGTGKSRMVDELSRSVFTIPFNIRSKDENRGLAFPLPDELICMHVVDSAMRIGTTVKDIECFYLCFLTCLFSKIKDELEEYRAELQKGTNELADWWRDHLRQPDTRRNLYSSVVGAAGTPSTVNIAVSEAKDAFSRLSAAIDFFGESLTPSLKVVLYFDEAHALMTVPFQSKNDPLYSGDIYLYDILCSALNHFLHEPLLVLFISTTSHLYQLAPGGPLSRSARERSNIDNLQAPITETPFDCSPSFPIRPRELTLENTCDIMFMSQFGRPLFWTLLQGAGDSRTSLFSSIISLARAKLLCQDKIDVGAGHVDEMARTAVVDVRLMLDYEPRRVESHRLQADLVAGHMRICYSVPQSREYMHSGYPSEPILAEAAAQQMYSFRKHDPRAILNILRDDMESGLLDMGECGELVGRELLMSAYDRAIEREDMDCQQSTTTPLQNISTVPSYAPQSYSRGVSLITFIEELFTEDNAHQILQSLPDNIKSETTFKDAFKYAKVRFTHFVKMGDDTGTTSAVSLVALTRGMAIIPQSGEFVVDVVIPILLHNDKLCEQVVSGLLVQFKRHRQSGPKANYLIDQRTVGFFPKGSSNSEGRPYISLIMELGVQLKGSIPTKEPRKSVPPASTTPPKVHITSQGGLHHTRDTHPRFSIFAYGCSNTVYKGIRPEQRTTYQYLLTSHNSLADHPRQHKGALEAVGRMKPFWKPGSASYHWVDEKGLWVEGSEIAEDDDDRLLTAISDNDQEKGEIGPSGGCEDPIIGQAVAIEHPEPLGGSGPSGSRKRPFPDVGSGAGKKKTREQK